MITLPYEKILRSNLPAACGCVHLYASLHLEASDAAELENCYHRLLEQKLSHSSIKGKIARLFHRRFTMPTRRKSAWWTNP